MNSVLHTELAVAPLVSIALATYNAGEYLHAQMESLLRQTYSDIEIVIADDGSDDGTFELLQRYAAHDSRVRLLPQSRRLGFNLNFMRCFLDCRGSLISPCDQDDIWSPEKTEKLVAACSGSGLATCDSRFIDEVGLSPNRGPARMSETRRMGHDPPMLGLLHVNAVSGHALMFPASLLGCLQDVPDASFFDWWIVVVARARGLPMRHVAETLVAYRRHGAAVTARKQDTPRTTGKQQLLRARYSTAYALAHCTTEGSQRLSSEYLKAFEGWLLGRFTVASAAYFWRERQSIFWTTSLKSRPALQAIKYIFGYRLRQMLRPHRHPVLRGISNGTLHFDPDR